jgi:cytidylate kinase
MAGYKKHVITLGGFPGSGKSTVKRLLGERLGYKTFSTGDFARNLAHERGLTLEEFNELVATSKELDLLIDEELMRIEREDDEYVIDSHLGYHFVPSGFGVYLDITLDTAALRIYGDRDSHTRIKTGDITHTLEEAREKAEKRILNHQERYLRHYGINPYVCDQYDCVVNSEDQTPEQIADAILVAYEGWLST